MENNQANQTPRYSVMNPFFGQRTRGDSVIEARRSRAQSDEHYIIDLCDDVLRVTALRQHRFPFLVGDPGKDGIRRPLPVDAHYPDIPLVVEFMERQHTEAVALFDRRMTVSGVPRGEQRRRYDARREEVLREQSIPLIVLHIAQFSCSGRRRLARRRGEDRAVVASALAAFAAAS